MPRFYLNVEYDDGSSLADEEGAEFADENAATVEARKALKALICETIDTDGVVVATHIHVVDDGGVARGVVSIGTVVPACVKRALGTA